MYKHQSQPLFRHSPQFQGGLGTSVPENDQTTDGKDKPLQRESSVTSKIVAADAEVVGQFGRRRTILQATNETCSVTF